MPTPYGTISTSEGPVNPDEELDKAIAEADAEEVIPFERIETDDLPELS